MMFVQSEGTAARRRFPLYLVDATDGLTPETGEAAGQPQVDKSGAGWVNTTATLTAIGNGTYYVELTATELNTLGKVSVRYKSANTAEFSGSADVVAFDVMDADPPVDVAKWLGTAAATPTVAGVPEVDVTHFNGVAAGAANISKTTQAIGRGTVGAASTTTSIVTSAFTPNGAAADQFKGRIVTFDADTTTAALQGQSTDITASSNAAAPVFTVTALTTAPVSGDTFSVT